MKSKRLKGKLPALADADIKGDLHVHSNWNGGANPIEKIAEAAMAMGHSYIGIADHTAYLKIERGLDEARLSERNREIDSLNVKLKTAGRDFLILKGCEANIMPDGGIDLPDEALAAQDFVIAGVHSHFKMTRAEMTERIVKAMRNPHVDIVSHRRKEPETPGTSMKSISMRSCGSRKTRIKSWRSTPSPTGWI